MRLTLLFSLCLFAKTSLAQVFVEVPPPSVFDGVTGSSTTFADVDGDGDSDVLITGSNSSFDAIAKLYLNDGAGNYTEVEDTPFDGSFSGAAAFSDIDGDGDEDVLITGDNGTERMAKLYTNDGTGEFTEVMGTPFTGVTGGSIAFSDVDADGDNDVLLTGIDNSFDVFSKLYLNDGAGNFSELPDTPFAPVFNGAVAFADIDGDNDEDLLIIGGESSSEGVAKLYSNDGTGSFTEVADTPFPGVVRGDVAFTDIDNDGDKDLIITGQIELFVGSAGLYTNDGTGVFSEVENTPFDSVYNSALAFSDIDNDGDEDLLITGRNNADERIAKLYSNDGLGGFSEVIGTQFDPVEFGAVAFSDVDNDGDNDVLITGRTNPERSAKFYANDGAGNFPVVMPPPFEQMVGGALAFSDIDGDGDEDVLLTGFNGPGFRIAKLYTNDGQGTFSEVPGTPFERVAAGSAIAFSDVDGDGDEDVLITGLSDEDRIAKLYLNDGVGTFTEAPGTPFEGVSLSAIGFSDVDGDGDQDVLITGQSDSGPRIAKLYTNDGQGSFTEVLNTPFDGVTSGSVAFADVDGDGDSDLLITGLTGVGPTSAYLANLYLNDGIGSFTEVMDTPFTGVLSSSIAFSDIDGDGDQDLLITGSTGQGQGNTKLYANDGTGSFSEVMDTPFTGVWNSALAFSDVDNDGDEDVLITGAITNDEFISKLYTNNGAGSFSEVMDTPFDGVATGAVAFSDVDGDGDQDVLLAGQVVNAGRITKLYLNESILSSTDGEPDLSGLDWSVYPNPVTHSSLNINVSANANGELTIQLFSLSGQLLIQEHQQLTIRQETYSIDIATLAKGAYFLVLTSGKTRSTAKVIVH